MKEIRGQSELKNCGTALDCFVALRGFLQEYRPAIAKRVALLGKRRGVASLYMRDGGLVRLSSRGTVPQFANPNLLFRLTRGMGEAAKEECGTALEENWGITHINTIDTVPLSPSASLCWVSGAAWLRYICGTAQECSSFIEAFGEYRPALRQPHTYLFGQQEIWERRLKRNAGRFGIHACKC